MKKLIFYFVLAGALPLGAQVFTRAMHDNNETAIAPLLTMHNQLYFIGQSYDASKSGMRYLYKLNQNGNQVFKKPLYTNVTAGIVTNDGHLILVGAADACADVITETKHQISITKIDSSGAVIQSSTDSVARWTFPTAVVQLPDSSYRMFTDSATYTYNKSLQFVGKIQINNITYAINENGGILAISNTGATASLISISANGTVVNAVPLATYSKKVLRFGNSRSLVLGGNGVLYLYDSNKSLVKTSNLSMPVQDFDVMNDSIYTITNSSSMLPGYAVLDSSFAILHSSVNNTKHFTQHNISMYGSRVAIIGQGLSTIINAGPPHAFATISVINKMGSNTFTEDVKLLSISADSSYSSYNNSQVANLYLRPKVNLQNNGASTITSFKLNFFLYISMSCGVYVWQEEISNLSIPPGGTASVSGKRFVVKSVVVPGPSPLPKMETFCFYTTVPNSEADKTFEDNEMCASFAFIITGLNEQNSDPDKVKIYPVPASSYIQVESATVVRAVSLIDVLGKQILSTHPEQKSVLLDLFEVPAGVYFVKVDGENGTVLKKVIKQ